MTLPPAALFLTSPDLAAGPPGRDLAVAALVGMFTAIGLQHLLFVGLRRRGAENLWFGLLCLSIALLTLPYSRAVYSAVLPALDRFRALMLAEVGAALTTAMLVRALFSLRFRWWERAVVAAFSLSLAVVLLVPAGALAVVHLAVDLMVAMALLFLLWRIVHLARTGAPLARLLLGGIAVFGASVVADLLAEYGSVPPLRLLPGLPGAVWGGFLVLILVFAAATARHWADSELHASTDALTGLPSRRALEDGLRREAARLERRQGSFSLVLLDLDHFKSVNDRYGHPKGDEVLRAVGRLLRHHTRNIDLPARLGGEEFAVLLVDCGQAGAVTFAERFRAALSGLRVEAGEEQVRVTASFGVAEAGPGVGVEELTAAADEALYRAKRGGRDRVAVAESPASEPRTPAPRLP